MIFEQCTMDENNLPELRLGELLLQDNLITKEQLEQALALQSAISSERHEKIGQILVSLGVLEKYQLIKYLVIQGKYNGEV